MVAGFKFGEQEGAFAERASAAHQAASGEGLALAGRRSGVAIGEQVGNREWFGVPLVNVQGVNERWSFQDDAHAGMPMAVNTALVSLGVAKPSLQIEIVLG